MESSVKHHAIVAAVAIGLTSTSQAALLAQYNFTSGSAVASTVLTGVSAGSFTIGNTTDEGSIGAADFGLSGGGSIFGRSDTTGSTEANALADDDYFSFTISAANPTEFLDLTSITFRLGATTDNATPFTTEAYLQSSVGGLGTGNPTIAGTNTTFSIAATTGLTYNTNAATFDLTGFSNVNSITFQIRLADNLDQNGKLTRIDDVTINGAVVPEPSSALLGGLALLALLRHRRR